MKFVAFDTNTVLDFLLKRPARYQSIQQLIDEAEAGTLQIYVPSPVFFEIEWVLRSYYKQPKAIILESLEATIELDQTYTEEKRLFERALGLFRQERAVSFVNCVIVCMARDAGVDELITGGRKLVALSKRLRS